MKEIVAIIRPNKVGATKAVLEKLGFPSMTALSVSGRGRQRGIASELNYQVPDKLQNPVKSGGMKYIPKRMLTLVVRDADVDELVQAIIEVNQTAQIGDGKIFVCPIDDAIRVRTSEVGDDAIA